MADQNITIKLTVDGTGTLKKATSDVDKLNKATDRSTASKKKTSKASEEVIKGQKGIHQSNLSSAKGFSKMNQMLDGGGGSSGLVAAYATLAANVFAATAAFNAFRGAAAFEQLGEGFTFMANQAGRTMDLVVDRLKEVSGEALSTEQALQGASLAISAGFSTDDLEKLTKVARGASLALGRNLADAFDRLTRGAIKLEPEILDELGIMVRLDDATEAYAATIGKTADQLTQFQRQTAFINAINEQGIEKYGELADAVEVNPYDKLAAAFSDLTHAGLGLINKVLVPLIEFFAGSQFGMTGAIILFSSTILTTMIPALGNMAKSAAGAAAQASKLAATELDAVDARIRGAESELKVGTKRTKTVKDLQKTIAEGGDIEKQAKITQRNLTRQLTTAENNLKKVKKSGTVEQIAAAEARKLQIEQEIVATGALGTATQAQLTQRTVASGAALAASQALIISEATLAISQVGIVAGFRIANAALKDHIAITTAATITTTGLAGAFARTAIGAKIAAAAVRLFGTALLTALPGIGMVLLVVGGLVMAFSSLFSSAADSKPLKALEKITESLNEKFAQLNTTINNLGESASKGDIRIRQLKMSAGVLLEIAGSIEEINQQAEKAKKLSVAKALEDIANTSNTTRIMLGGGSSPEDQGERAKRRVQDEGFEPLKEALVGVASDTSRASAELRKQLQIAFDEEMGEDSVLNAGGILKFIQQLRPEQFTKISDAVQKASITTTEYDQALTNLKRSLSEGEQVFSKFFSKAAKTTEFDGIVDQFKTFEESIGALKDKQGPALEEAFKGMGSQFRKFMTDVERGAGDEGIKSFINRVPGIGKAFKKLQKDTQTLQVDLKKLNIESASLKSLSKVSAEGMSAFLNKQNEAVQKQIDLNDLELATLRTLDETAEITDEINRLTTLNLGLNQKIKTDALIILEASLVQVSHDQKKLKIARETSKMKEKEALATAKIARLMSTGSAELNPAKQQRLLVANAKAATKFAEDENKIIKRKIILEHNRTQQKLVDNAIATGMDLELFRQSSQNIFDLMELDVARADAKLAMIKKENELVEAQGMASGDLFTVAQTIKDMATEGERAAGVGVLVATAFAPMVEAFNELGTPEGGALANAIERFSQLTITMMAFKETVKELKETLDSLGDKKDILGSLGISNEQLAKGLTAMAALGQAIGAIGALATANAEMQVAAIDKQIAAEKKLDGNSKASLSRIDAMEKKKIAIQKKAFETEKKIKIASAMISGLTGAVMAFAAAQVIPPPAGQIIGAAMAATVMALTAKNIALISATQFSGGASTGGGTPQTISVGRRGSSIDTAMGATGGELSYLRGESGQGSNANNFRPGGASGMKRGYNTGGAIVGEQGPEELQITSDGYNIIPNDKMGGRASNVNFTINAVDAAGVADVLTAQRGTIISMIQEAAHEHGEEFIESVNPQTYAGGDG